MFRFIAYCSVFLFSTYLPLASNPQKDFEDAISVLKQRIDDVVALWKAEKEQELEDIQKKIDAHPESVLSQEAVQQLRRKERELRSCLKKTEDADEESRLLAEMKEIEDTLEHQDLNGERKKLLYDIEDCSENYVPHQMQKSVCNIFKTFEKEYAAQLRPFLTRPFESHLLDENGELTCLQNCSAGEGFYYKLLVLLEQDLPFRGAKFQRKHFSEDEEPNTFYRSGTVQSWMDKRFQSLDQVGFSAICNTGDIYTTRHHLCEFELKRGLLEGIDVPILLATNQKDGHGNFNVHFLDLENNRAIASVFCNSRQDPDYYSHIEQRFNLGVSDKGYYGKWVSGEEMEDVRQRFSAQECQSIQSTDKYCGQHKLLFDWAIPMVDCSFNLQTNKGDLNCALYAYEYVKGVAEMFQDKSIVDKALSDARKIAKNKEDSEALESMRELFQKRVKRHLPMYYQADGEKHSEETIKNHHSKLRWDIGSEWFQERLAPMDPANGSV